MSEIQLGKNKTSEAPASSPLDGPGVALDPAWFEQPSNEPPFARQVLTTPLHLVSATENRTNSWSDWNGYTVADIYTSFDQEYDALRTRAALSDISPLVKYRISGREAEAYLDRLLTKPVSGVEIDNAVRALICASDGYIVTEGLLFRMGERDFRLTVSSSHLNWLLDAALGFEVTVEDVSGTVAALSLAGSLAEAALEAAGAQPKDRLSKNRASWTTLGGMPVYISRTGMLGGAEYELWMDPSDAPIVWQRLLEKGRPFGLIPAGQRARNVARIENGVALAGVDYKNAFSSSGRAQPLTPFSLGLGALVDLQTPVFNGRAALQRVAAKGCKWVVVGFEYDAEQGASLSDIYVADRLIGQATSHAWSPGLCRNIALAVIETDALGTTGGFSALVTGSAPGTGGKRQPVTLSKRPFLRFS